jgi:hypothetical protein
VTSVRIALVGTFSVLVTPAGTASGIASGSPAGSSDEPTGMLKLIGYGPPSLVVTTRLNATVDRHATDGSR